MKKAIHFGAGKLGKALVAQIYNDAKYKIIFVDNNKKMVDILSKKQKFTIHTIGGLKPKKVIENISALHILKEDEIIKAMLKADIISTSIVPSNLINLVKIFNKYLNIKKKANSSKLTNIVCIENGVKVSDAFKEMLTDTNNKSIAFCNAIADGICMLTDDTPYEDVWIENFQELRIESKNWLGDKIPLVSYDENIDPNIMKKFWLLNSSQSLMAWYSQDKFKYVYQFASDKKISKKISDYMDWVISVLNEKYPSLTNKKLKDYKQFIWKRFSNKTIPDTVERVARNFKLKVSENDRFVTIIKNATSKEFGINVLKELYKLNTKHIWDLEISNYTKKHGIKKAMKKYSNL